MHWSRSYHLLLALISFSIFNTFSINLFYCHPHRCWCLYLSAFMVGVPTYVKLHINVQHGCSKWSQVRQAIHQGGSSSSLPMYVTECRGYGGVGGFSAYVSFYTCGSPTSSLGVILTRPAATCGEQWLYEASADQLHSSRY